MRVILFGATGMLGSGVLLECLDDPGIDAVVSVVRRRTGVAHPKLKELVHEDFLDFVPICEHFADADATFYCLGVSSAGMSEADYRRVTRDFTLAAAKEIRAENPPNTFCFISGASTDATGRGRVMWARVKGETENALAGMGFKAAYMFRPGYIQPLRGVRSKTLLYQMVYNIAGPLYPLFKSMAPSYVTTTVDLAHAMIEAARSGYSRSVLETPDINRLAQQYDAHRGAA
jgi:uncharacterized protein YbjT (DUF2867 family)